MGWPTSAGGCAVAAAGLAFALAACGGVDASGADPNSSAGTTTTGGANGAGAGSHAGGAAAGHSAGGVTASGGVAASGGNSGGSASAGQSAAGAAGTPVNVYIAQLRGREGCLVRELPVAAATGGGLEAGQTRCGLTEIVMPAPGAACACDASEHLVLTAPVVAEAVRRNAQAGGYCDGASGVSCASLCLCDIRQSAGAALTQCQTDAATPSAELPPGFCYVDLTLTPPLGNAALVSTCPANSRRELRILGPAPESEQVLFLACPGASL